MKIHDISKTLDENMVIYPGDSGINIKSFKKDGWNLSEICLGSHTGTHVDTRLHIKDGHSGVDKIPLTRCIGNSVVIDLRNLKFGDTIKKADLVESGMNMEEIVLLKTINSDIRTNQFQKDFITLSPEAAEFLAGSGVRTLAFDYLSVGSRETHEILLNNNILIFENVDLSNVNPGKYKFVGLPIKLTTEGAPARVILIKY